MPKPIQRENLLLAEGLDAKLFFMYLFDTYKIENIDVHDFGGIDNLPKYITTLKKMGNYNTVKTILIIRDSEESTKSAIQSVNSALKSTELIDKDIEPFTITEFNARKIGFMLFPGYDENGQLCKKGTLEDLCLKIFKDRTVLKQTGGYFEDFLKYKKLKREHKNRLHAAFSFTDDYVGNKIGETAKTKGFDYESSYFAPFLDIIKKIDT
jgi:hypothetical protein